MSTEAREVLKELEGLRLEVYKDSAGKDTIGYGHLITAPIGPISQAQADQWFDDDVRAAENKIMARIKVPLDQHQHDALVMLVFNVPDAIYSGTVEDKINAGTDVLTLEKTWKAWNKIRDPKTGQLKVSAGLVARRNKEWTWYNSGQAGILKNNMALAAAGILLIVAIALITYKI